MKNLFYKKVYRILKNKQIYKQIEKHQRIIQIMKFINKIFRIQIYKIYKYNHHLQTIQNIQKICRILINKYINKI